MRKLLALAALATVVAAPSIARAHGFITTGHRQYDQYGFSKTHGPRAAPWFTYWPYQTYFNNPAPTGAAFPPSHMTPGGFNQHMYQGGNFLPYPTNGYGQ